jgi:hypothetical protein
MSRQHWAHPSVRIAPSLLLEHQVTAIGRPFHEIMPSGISRNRLQRTGDFMKTISPWFQTAELMTAVRNAISNLQTARPDPSSDIQSICADRNGLLLRCAETGRTTA